MKRRYRLLASVIMMGYGATLAHAQSVTGQTIERQGNTQKPVLGGFDLNLTLWESSGLDVSPEAYENQLALYMEPEFHIGRRFWKGHWAELLTVSARMLVQTELAGNDAAFRSSHFASPVLLRDAPEQVAIGQAAANASAAATPTGQIDGPNRRVWYSDLWLSVTHGHVATIPKLKVDIGVGARLVIPTSLESRIAGLQAAPSIFVGFSKKLWRFHLDYGFRAVKYFYESRVAPLASSRGPVIVNGVEVDPFRPASSGVANPNFGFVNAFSVSVDLPRGFSIVGGYYLFNVFAYSLDQCTVPGVPAANPCTDGRLIGDTQSGAQRDSQWFLFEVDWKARSWFTLGLGLSTFGPTRLPNGDLANPFFRVSRENHSTVYLSLAVSAEELASAIKRRNQKQ